MDTKQPLVFLELSNYIDNAAALYENGCVNKTSQRQTDRSLLVPKVLIHHCISICVFIHVHVVTTMLYLTLCVCISLCNVTEVRQA